MGKIRLMMVVAIVLVTAGILTGCMTTDPETGETSFAIVRMFADVGSTIASVACNVDPETQATAVEWLGTVLTCLGFGTAGGVATLAAKRIRKKKEAQEAAIATVCGIAQTALKGRETATAGTVSGTTQTDSITITGNSIGDDTGSDTESGLRG